MLTAEWVLLNDVIMSSFRKITDLELQALVDGELPPERRRTLMAEIIRTPDYLQRYESLKKQKAMLKEWWQNHHQEN